MKSFSLRFVFGKYKKISLQCGEYYKEEIVNFVQER